MFVCNLLALDFVLDFVLVFAIDVVLVFVLSFAVDVVLEFVLVFATDVVLSFAVDFVLGFVLGFVLDFVLVFASDVDVDFVLQNSVLFLFVVLVFDHIIHAGHDHLFCGRSGGCSRCLTNFGTLFLTSVFKTDIEWSDVEDCAGSKVIIFS